MTAYDYGFRCQLHRGHVWLPHCAACEGQNREYQVFGIEPKTEATNERNGQP